MRGIQQVPPPLTGSAEARLFELAPGVFEELCLVLIRALPDIQSAEKHGKLGQADDAVDIVGRRVDGQIDLFQCKGYKTYTGAHLKSHINKFLEKYSEWRIRGDIARYVLIVACPTDHTSVHRELEAAEAKFQGLGVKIELWSSGTVTSKVGDFPNIVRRFFHDYWVDKLCSRPDAERAIEKLEECGKRMLAVDFNTALALAREALAIAQGCGDRPIEQRARRAVFRSLGCIVVSENHVAKTTRQNLLDEMEDHVQALEDIGSSLSIVARMRSQIACLRMDTLNAVEFARTARREAGDDADLKAGALIAELQALWQQELPEEGLALAKEVDTLLATPGEDSTNLPLEIAWLRTLCRAGRATVSDVDAFVRSVRGMVERDRNSAPYGILLLDEAASEFSLYTRLEEVRTLCHGQFDLAILADEPWRAGTTSLNIASASSALNLKDDARRYLGEAEQWFETTRQRDLHDTAHRTRWVVGMAKTLMAKGNILIHWSHGEDNPGELLKEASGAFSMALALIEKHGAELPCDANLFVGECHYYLASIAIDLGRYDDASTHFVQVRSPARMANPQYSERFGSRAMLGEAWALTFGGNINQACAILTEMLASPSLDADKRQKAALNLAWIEESIVPVTDWYSSDAAMKIRDKVGQEGLRKVIADQARPLVDLVELFRSRGEQNLYSSLIDLWGRGGFSRVATAVRASPWNAITVSATSVEEIARWVRVFSPLYDTVIVIWKGALEPTLALVPMPDYLGEPGMAGGQGYIAACGDELVGLDGFCPAFGWANLMPKNISVFLGTQAFPLIRSGRLVVLPGPLVGCTQSAIGWTDNLLVDNAFGGVVTVAGLSNNEGRKEGAKRLLDLATTRIPYIDGVPLSDLDTVLEEMSDWLSPLRRMLRSSISGDSIRQERWEQLGPCFDDIRDACRQLDDRWRSLTARGEAANWRVEAITSAFSAGERSNYTIGKNFLTDVLHATVARSPEIGPWVPFWRLTQAGGKIDWSRPLDNPSTPPDDHAKTLGFRSPVTQGWLYPGDGGPDIPTFFVPA